MTEKVKKKGEYCLNRMGYQPYKKTKVWKKTFGFALIVAEIIDGWIVFKGYSSSENDTFTVTSVRIPLADFMPVEDIREEIAYAECHLGINTTSACKYVDWGFYDPEELDIAELHLIKELNKEEQP